MLTVICVYWKGFLAGRNYDENWVYRLRDNVKQYLPVEHKFVCLSNQIVPGVETIPLTHDYPGWWSKVELFRPDIPGKRFLYLDLDTLPIGNLTDLVNLKGKFIGIYPDIANVHERKNPKRTFYIASGVMVYDKGYAGLIYDLFEPEVMERLAGDQDWIGEILVKHEIPFNVFSKEWIRLLRTLNSDPNKLPADCRVICCSPNGWRQDCVVNYKGKQYEWVEKLWKGELVKC